MVDARQHSVGGALERGAVKRDVGGRSPGPDPQAVGLGELVVVVGTDRHPFHGSRHLVTRSVLGRIQRREKGPGAGKLVGFPKTFGGPDAVVGRATQDGMAHGFVATSVLHIVAHRVSAARVGHQHHLRGARSFQDLVHFGFEKGHVFGGGRAPRLGLAVVVARQGVGQIDGMQAVARPPVRFKAPQRGLPDGGGVAIAVHKHDGRLRVALRRGGACAQQEAGGERGEQGATGRHGGVSSGEMDGRKRCGPLWAGRLGGQANTPAVSCMRADTSPRWCRVSP